MTRLYCHHFEVHTDKPPSYRKLNFNLTCELDINPRPSLLRKHTAFLFLMTASEKYPYPALPSIEPKDT